MSAMRLPLLFSSLFACAVTGASFAQTTSEAETRPAAPPAAPTVGRVMSDLDAQAEGEIYRSVEAGLELRLPPGQPADVNELADPDLLALVTNPDEQWRFELRKLSLDRPMELETEELPEGGVRVGLLDLMANELRREVNGDILRKDLTPLGDADAGVFAVRYSLGPTTLLRQDALIRADETLYYRLSLISPAPSGPIEELANDPAVRSAVEQFNRTFDSFEKIDQTALREDQEQRLLATRALLVNLGVRGRMANATAGEQWWRIRRGEEEIGYARVIEEPANRLPDDLATAFTPEGRQDGAADTMTAEGVRTGVALRLRTGEGTIARRTWSYTSRDLQTSDFRESNQLFRPGEAEPNATGASAGGWVIGQMRTRTVPRQVQVPRPGGLGSQTMMDIVERRKLEVTYTLDGEVQDTVVRQLPAWFVPQAADHLLPRLVAPWGEAQYMIAVYAPDRREVMNKYIDVAPPRQMTTPAGERRLVMLVTTRLGLAGAPTRHYVDAESYAWLGSVNDETGIRIWPGTREDIAEVWQDTTMVKE